jgi:hypothetical protein
LSKNLKADEVMLEPHTQAKMGDVLVTQGALARSDLSAYGMSVSFSEY